MDPAVFTFISLGLSPPALLVLVRSGALSRRAFDAAPPRRGTLGLPDLFITAALFLVLPSLFIQAVFVAGEPNRAGRDPVTSALLGMLCAQAGLAVVVGYVLFRASAAVVGGLRGWGLREAPRSIPRAAMAFVLVVPLVVATSALIGLLVMLLGGQTPVIAHDTLEVMVKAEPSRAWWGLVVSAVVFAPLLEELIFRGMIQTALMQSGVTTTRWAAIAWTSLLFALIHIDAASPHALPVLYVLSLGLGWAYERWGSLWAPIFMHVMFNTLQIILAMSLPPNGPPTSGV